MVRSTVILAAIAAASVVAFAQTAPDGTNVFAIQDPQPPPRQSQGEVNVLMNNPGSHPKIGFQAFAPSSPALADAATTIADVLAADLDYEREFYVIPRKASAGISAAATPQALPFTQWTDLGADVVMMGSLRDAGGGKVDVEVKLINVRPSAAGKQEFGQTYGGCTAASIRYCAHSISDDMHKQLRNLDGIARTKVVYTTDRDGEASTGRPIENAAAGKEIHFMDYDGASDQRYTHLKRLSISPSWGPDARTMVFTSYAPMPDVFLATLDGRPLTRPAQGTDSISNTTPVLSPDGSKIAFMSTRGGSGGYYDVWVVNRDGSNPHNVTPGTERSSEGAPTWSPDGAFIAFTSDRTGTNQIFIMNADGTHAERKTFAGKSDHPTWSKLGYIAYTLERSGGHDIAVLDLARGESRVLTDGVGSCRQPTAAPNGRHIVFVTTRWGGKEHLASIDYPDGGHIRQLTTQGNNTYPNWSPLPGGGK
jgi:TolB protein